MYRKIRAFVAPRDKVLAVYFNPSTRVEIAFTKRDIMIYDFLQILHYGVYDVTYDLENFNVNKFLEIIYESVEYAPKNLAHLKFFVYVRNRYNHNYWLINGKHGLPPKNLTASEEYQLGNHITNIFYETKKK